MKFAKAAALFGALGIALGAFGAHALKAALEASGSTSAWETAVLYHLAHAVALLALGLSGYASSKAGKAAGYLWIAGICLFSGSLYLLALTQLSFLGPITPLGGLCFIAGWLSLFGLKR